MTSARLRSLAFFASLPLIAGCLPTDMPAYVNDGKTIVALGKDAGGEKMILWTYDLQTKKATPHPPPNGLSVELARMFGDQVWVGLEWRDNYPKGVTPCMRFDPVKKEFVAGLPEVKDFDWLRDSILASYEGKQCVLFQSGADPVAGGKRAYEVLTFPELKKSATVSQNEVVSAGSFNWLTFTTRQDGKGGFEPGPVDVFNEKQGKLFSISMDELHKMKIEEGDFGYARINKEERVLLFIRLGSQLPLHFGVFDTNNGKFLWGGPFNQDTARGNPLVKRHEVWSLEYAKRGGTSLVRHTPGEKPNEDKRETVLTLRGTNVSDYTPSPDASHFIAQTEGEPQGKPSRLLFIPIKEKVTAQEVTVVELVETKPDSK